MESLHYVIAQARGAQRVVLVAIGILPLVLVTVAALPAVLVLPFTGSRGVQHAGIMVRDLVTWTRVLLHGSRSTGR